MDFNDTPQEAEFRAKCTEFLQAHARPATEDTVREWRALSETEQLAKAKAWQKTKFENGFSAITWSKEHGGQGGTPMQSVIYNQEEAKYDVPRGFFDITLGMCIPTMLHYATEEQKQRFAPAALNGEEVWCQLFSEPSAGSDVAGVRTKCERDGDDWIINGQKVWTSGAHYADWGIIVCRHDPDQPKHKGLTYFFVDMKSPGVEVRPIKQASGGSSFNEVYFTDVRVPDTQRLGEVGEGWKVALTTLMHERLAIGGGSGGPDYREFMELARNTEFEDGPAINNAAVREKLADWYVRGQGLKYTRYRTLTALSQGAQPGPESSIGKVVTAPKLQDLTSFAMDLQDMGGVVTGEGAPHEGTFQQAYMWAPGLRIAGGTDEILRNIIAERVLGLPGDIRVDKDIPFKDLPKGK